MFFIKKIFQKTSTACLFFCVIAALFLFLPLVSADMGPKPSSSITIYFNGEKATDATEAQMMVCLTDSYDYNPNPLNNEKWSFFDDEKGCMWNPSPLAWTNGCNKGVCNFNYFLPSSFRLAVYLRSQDKVFVTQEIERNNFDSTYRVDISQDGTAIITETTSFLLNTSLRTFIVALILTLLIELGIAGIYQLVNKEKYGGLNKWILLANIISLPFVWFIFPLLFTIGLAILLAEIFVVFFEAFVYFKAHKKLTYWNYFGLSLVLNLGSFVIGGFISVFLSFFGLMLF